MKAPPTPEVGYSQEHCDSFYGVPEHLSRAGPTMSKQVQMCVGCVCEQPREVMDRNLRYQEELGWCRTQTGRWAWGGQ